MFCKVSLIRAVFCLLVSVFPFQTASATYVYDLSVEFEIEEDSLCFINRPDTFIGKAIWPLQQIANKGGACQGMVGISRTFLSNVELTCASSEPDPKSIEKAIARAMKYHRYGCEEKVAISGYCNLADLCENNIAFIQRRAVYENALLTLRDTGPYYRELNQGATEQSQLRNARTIKEIEKELRQGRSSLILYPMHVVLVHRLTMERLDNQQLQATLYIYDPNMNTKTVRFIYLLDKDGTRTIAAKRPIFPVSPKKQPIICRSLGTE